MSTQIEAPHLVAQRLTDARKASGRTQEEACAHLGMSRPTFIAIEKGLRTATPEEILKLASFYGRSVHELIRPGAPTVSLEPHRRTALSAARPDYATLQKAIGEMQRLAEDYAELERLLNNKLVERFPNEITLPKSLSARSLRAFAENVAVRERARLFLGDQPIPNLRHMLENEVGIRIFLGDIPSGVAGMYAFVADVRYCVMINRLHPIERRRATLAHEYGHFLCDRHKPGIDYLEEQMRRSLNERFVEAFAMSFLMPETGIRRQFHEVCDSSGDFQVADLCRLSNFYCVSVQAMALRMEALELIPDGTWDFLKQEQFKVADARLALNLERLASMDSNEVYPIRYKYLAVQAYEQGLISEGQLARFLRCDRTTARDIVEQCINRYDDVDALGKQAELILDFQHSLLRPVERQAV